MSAGVSHRLWQLGIFAALKSTMQMWERELQNVASLSKTLSSRELAGQARKMVLAKLERQIEAKESSPSTTMRQWRTEDDGGKQGTASTRNSSNKDSSEPRGNLPLILAELQAKRAAAAKARVLKEGSSNASSALTPLGSILILARKELARLLELLTQLELKIDGVKGDETVRPPRRIQTTRMQSLLSALEKLSSESGQ